MSAPSFAASALAVPASITRAVAADKANSTGPDTPRYPSLVDRTVRALLICVRHALVDVADPANPDAAYAEPQDQVIRLTEGIGACNTTLQQALTMFGAAYDALGRVG